MLRRGHTRLEILFGLWLNSREGSKRSATCQVGLAGSGQGGWETHPEAAVPARDLSNHSPTKVALAARDEDRYDLGRRACIRLVLTAAKRHQPAERNWTLQTDCLGSASGHLVQ